MGFVGIFLFTNYPNWPSFSCSAHIVLQCFAQKLPIMGLMERSTNKLSSSSSSSSTLSELWFMLTCIIVLNCIIEELCLKCILLVSKRWNWAIHLDEWTTNCERLLMLATPNQCVVMSGVHFNEWMSHVHIPFVVSFILACICLDCLD